LAAMALMLVVGLMLVVARIFAWAQLVLTLPARAVT